MIDRLTITLAQHPDGADVARRGEHIAISRHGAVMALARRPVAVGVLDGPWQAERNGVSVLRGPNLHRLAGLTIHEDDKGIRLRKWRGRAVMRWTRRSRRLVW